jgi:hypothetical protein
MRIGAVPFGIAALLVAAAVAPAAHAGGGRFGGHALRRTINGPLNTLDDIGKAMRACWVWPPIDEISTGMELTVLLSFQRDGKIFGGRITYETPNISRKERALYYIALADAINRCSPLPVSDSLGKAIAGQLFTFRFNDTRKQKKA